MTDHRARIERLHAYLAHVDERIAGYEAMARRAKGPVSRPFAERLEQLKAERTRLAERLADERLQDALSWSGDSAGALQVADEIGHRIDELLRHVDAHEPHS